MAWSLHKVFKQIYEKVNVNSEMFDFLGSVEKDKKIPIILLPTHRSYIDFLIVSYIFFLYKLKLPYIISDEALMNTFLIPFLIKSSGAFFFRPAKFRKSNLYQAIFNEYIQKLLINGNNLEFFIEGTRSRTGKVQEPRLEILDIIIETVEQGQVNDVCLAPLTINYEKVLEGDTFPGELLGEEKVEESLIRVIKAIPLLKVNFGRVYV
jgi:glycerol-3-phosphate O-acyltransferase